MAKIKPDFDSRGVKIIGLSVDPLDKHEAWVERHRGDAGPRSELPADRRTTTSLSRRRTGCSAPTSRAIRRPHGGRQPDRCGNVFVIGPDKKIKLISSTR
jgi:alkyl hydroperoxide reductase subunit AhpC